MQLSLDDAVKRALENNLDIQVAKYDPDAASLSIKQAQGAFDTLLTSTLRDARNTSQATNVFAGAQSVTTDTKTWNFGATQPLKTGGTLTLTFNNNKQDTNSVFSTINPVYNSVLNGSLTQPLLRNFKLDANRQQIKVSKKNKEISDIQFKQTVTNTIATVKAQYYDLLAAIDNLEAQRKSLSLAQKLLDENRIKVRVGTLAPLDVVQADSEVAGREAGVITAEQQVSDAEDTLRKAIFSRLNNDQWNTRIVPTDRPVAEPYQIDPEAAVKRALDNRTDIQVARKNLEITDWNVELAKNQVLPALDLTAGYGGNGSGGTQIIRASQGGPIVSTVPGGYSDALGFLLPPDFPTWFVGFNFSLPLPNRTARANSARARLASDQARTSLARLEMGVLTDVRVAMRAVETNWRLVLSTRAARTLQAQRLDAEEKKFAAGMSTNFFVTQAQRDLAVAEVQELQAIASYRKSIITFERSQETGLSSGGSLTSIVVSTR